MTKWIRGQWPDSICSGFIVAEPSQYGGYMFRDASHGIPVLGHVTPSDIKLDGCKVVYHGSYPDQAERIARRLVACWNAMAGHSLEDLERMAAEKVANFSSLEKSSIPLTEDEANERADNGRNTGGKSYR